jgi:hypothetical protein
MVKKDVLIGFPCYDNKAEVAILQEVIHAIMDPNCPVGSVQYYNGDSLIPRGRNKIAKMFLDSPYNYLMFIDSDIIFAREQIARLRSHDKGIVGGVYLKKKLPYEPVCNAFLGEEGPLAIMREIGTGFMMIRRDVFAGIQSMFPEHDYKADDDEPKEGHRYHDWFRVGVENGRYLSEDWFFCQNAAKLGYKTYQDQSILVEHVGRMTYPTKDGALVSGIVSLLENINTDHALPEGSIESILKAVNTYNERHPASPPPSLESPASSPTKP